VEILRGEKADNVAMVWCCVCGGADKNYAACYPGDAAALRRLLRMESRTAAAKREDGEWRMDRAGDMLEFLTFWHSVSDGV
jgi:hypothetical protein